ncbi:MAG: DUF5054 domain-containing protein [Verrucomicrobia bacterium]|nr:DUF5054 domain-containing protein [Verrucomicrobiota bacterium]
MPRLRRILVVFKTHLDIGYTDLGAAVLRQYCARFIPRALAAARELREAGGPDRFVWTTGSWLITEYLERARPAARRQLEQAIAAGDLAWHALPFTWHSELLDEGLVDFGLSLAADLDRRFGRRTIAAKMTDVPGHTRSLVPLLARAGVKFLHLGVNPATPVPATPPVFRWRAPGGAEVIVAYGGDYGRPVRVPGCLVGLHFAHTGDNHGPQDPAAVRATLAAVRAAHPGAEVTAGTLDEFARALRLAAARLPVVTDEIGDTWIHGVASDPWKVARYRALLEFRRTALARRPRLRSTPSFRRFSRELLLVPEHTWGRDTKIVIPRKTGPWVIYTPGHWRKPGFERDRRRGLFRGLEASWREQRAYLAAAVAALPPGPWRRAARQAVAACRAVRPARAGLEPVAGRRVTVAGHEMQFDRRGALVHWRTPEGRELAGPRHPLGLFSYQVFSPADYERWFRSYVVNHAMTETWSRPDFTKFGYEKLRGLRARRWHAELLEVFLDLRRHAPRVVLKLRVPAAASRDFGCPPEVQLAWTPPVGLAPARFSLQWFGKPASRIPESAWCSFVPRVPHPAQWRLVKLGAPIDPRRVVPRGNRRIHAIERAVHPTLAIVNRHAPVVALDRATLLDFRPEPPDLRHGLHFNLVNNAWGTNFVQWTEGSARFEFELHV